MLMLIDVVSAFRGGVTVSATNANHLLHSKRSDSLSDYRHEFLVVHDKLIHKNKYTNSSHAKGWAHHDHDVTSGYNLYSQHHAFH